MRMESWKPQPEERDRRVRREEAEKVRVAIVQLECADLYLAAAVNVELEDRELTRMLDGVRREVLWARDQLSSVRVVP
jgi:hypothetical protein